MKINGHVCEGPKPEVIVIPKGSTKYVFKASTVSTDDWSEFNRLCPKPNPPSITTKNGTKNDVNDKTYQEEMLIWTQAKTDFMILKSLQSTEGLEWDNVDYNNPSTWNTWADDLLGAGFYDPEITQLINMIMEAQGLNAAKIDAATKSFLAAEGANL